MVKQHRPPPATRRALRKLGQDIKEARLRRGLPLSIIAERAGTTRQAVARIEAGEHTVSIGIALSVLQALGLLDRVAEIADRSTDLTGQEIASQELPQRAYLKRSGRQRT